MLTFSDGMRPGRRGENPPRLSADPGKRAHKVAGKLRRASCKGVHRTTVERGRASGVRHFKTREAAAMLAALTNL